MTKSFCKSAQVNPQGLRGCSALSLLYYIMQSRQPVPEGPQQYFKLKSQPLKITLPPDSKEYIHIHSEFVELLKSKPADDMKVVAPKPNRKELIQFLETGNNLCFYGLGSKIAFIEQLAKEAFPHLNIFVINGYLPQVTERNIIGQLVDWLNRIGSEEIQRPNGPKSMRILCERIEQLVDFQFVIVFHNIDGPNLMNTQTQLNLSELGKCHNIHLIASVDNSYLGLRWSPNTISNFRFLFQHIATGQTYVQQLKSRFRSDQKHDRQQQALRFIWRSLTPNQKQLLKIVARRQLANLEGQPQIYYTFSQLFEQCINLTVLASQTQLRQNLFEIIDHKVVQQSIKGGRKVYIMNYDRKILQNIVNSVYE